MTCSGPFRGAAGTQQLARLHWKGAHRLEAWRSGSVSKSRMLRAKHRSLQNKRYPFRTGIDLQNTDTNPYAKFPQVFYSHNSHRCSIPTIPIDVLLLKAHFGAGAGAGCSGLDGPSVLRIHKKHCPPSIRKRCACGFPQGTTRATSPRFQQKEKF